MPAPGHRDSGSRSRPHATTIGRRAEEAVAQYLLDNNYKLLGRNVRLGYLELDIVAQKGSLVAIVEVRHRGPTSWESPLESIHATKQRRLLIAAERLWAQRFADDPTVEQIRIDIAAVAFEPAGIVVDYFEGGIEWNDVS